jgi:hypothetical protein
VVNNNSKVEVSSTVFSDADEEPWYKEENKPALLADGHLAIGSPCQAFFGYRSLLSKLDHEILSFIVSFLES